jgi:hypothetical protein
VPSSPFTLLVAVEVMIWWSSELDLDVDAGR